MICISDASQYFAYCTHFLHPSAHNQVQQSHTGFHGRSLLEQALKHRSSVSNVLKSNERLEFLGDAVLGLVVAEKLYNKYPSMREGGLTSIRKEVVSKVALSRYAPVCLYACVCALSGRTYVVKA